MTEIELLKRRLKLRRQAARLIKQEIRRDQRRLALLRIKAGLEGQMTNDFDPILSRKLDAVLFLLDHESGG